MLKSSHLLITTLAHANHHQRHRQLNLCICSTAQVYFIILGNNWNPIYVAPAMLILMILKMKSKKLECVASNGSW